MEWSCWRDLEWRILCEQASKEQDPKRLLQLVQRLSEVWEEQRQKQASSPVSRFS